MELYHSINSDFSIETRFFPVEECATTCSN